MTTVLSPEELADIKWREMCDAIPVSLTNDEHIVRMLSNALQSIANARMMPMDEAKDLMLETAVKLIRAVINNRHKLD